MSNPGEADLTPITGPRQLAEWFAAGAKPRERWGVGTEHEKFGFRRSDLSPPPYEPDGIRALLEGLAARGWTPILDEGKPIGLKRGGASISLEPGGQLELSGAVMPDLHATRLELREHVREVHEAAGAMGIGFAPLGFHPLAARDDMPWMPKGRYAIMRRHMPTGGRARPRHDAPHLHGAGQPRLRRRSGHGGEAPRVPGVAAGGDRAVRQLALHRGQAQRLPFHARAGLDGHGPGPHRHPRRGVRAGLRLRALRRMGARRAHVFRGAERQVAGRGRPELPRLHGGPPRRRARGRARHHGRLRRPRHHRLHRRPPQALPGDARRRRGRPGHADGGARRCGSGCSTTTRRRRRRRR